MVKIEDDSGEIIHPDAHTLKTAQIISSMAVTVKKKGAKGTTKTPKAKSERKRVPSPPSPSLPEEAPWREIEAIIEGIGIIVEKFDAFIELLPVEVSPPTVEAGPQPVVRGTATGGANFKLVDEGKSWETDAWAHYEVELISGIGQGQVRTISSNTNNALTIGIRWETNPERGTVYVIRMARVNVNIAAAAATVDVDIVAQTVGRITVDIGAQSIGNIAVDLAAQSVSSIDVDIIAQTIAGLNINIKAQSVTLNTQFSSQVTGVMSTSDWATQEADDLHLQGETDDLAAAGEATLITITLSTTIEHWLYTVHISGTQNGLGKVRANKTGGYDELAFGYFPANDGFIKDWLAPVKRRKDSDEGITEITITVKNLGDAAGDFSATLDGLKVVDTTAGEEIYTTKADWDACASQSQIDTATSEGDVQLAQET